MINKLSLYLYENRIILYVPLVSFFIFNVLSRIFKEYIICFLIIMAVFAVVSILIIILTHRGNKLKCEEIRRNIIRQYRLVNNVPKKEIKRLISKEDPYGEEDWEN